MILALQGCFCYGLSCVPPKDVEVLIPSSQPWVSMNVTLFGNKAFADDQVQNSEEVLIFY